MGHILLRLILKYVPKGWKSTTKIHKIIKIVNKQVYPQTIITEISLHLKKENFIQPNAEQWTASIFTIVQMLNKWFLELSYWSRLPSSLWLPHNWSAKNIKFFKQKTSTLHCLYLKYHHQNLLSELITIYWNLSVIISVVNSFSEPYLTKLKLIWTYFSWNLILFKVPFMKKSMVVWYTRKKIFSRVTTKTLQTSQMGQMDRKFRKLQ